LDSDTESSVAVAVLGDVVDDEDEPPHAHENKDDVIAACAASLATFLRSAIVIESDRWPFDPRVVKR
jgi:hypothetical protein